MDGNHFEWMKCKENFMHMSRIPRALTSMKTVGGLIHLDIT